MQESENENKTPTKSGKKRGDKRSLKTMQDMRLFLASVIRRVEAGTLDESRGRCLVYCSQVLITAIREGDIEKRLEALEAKAGGINHDAIK